MARYPRPKSATIPLCHLAQEQDGYLADDAMGHIAELVGVTAAEVLGTASFYEMFKRQPVGRYLVNVCTNISCQLLGGEELLAHAERRRSASAPGATTPTACSPSRTSSASPRAPRRRRARSTTATSTRSPTTTSTSVVADIRSGKRTDIPPHGTLGLVRQDLPADRIANITPPEQQSEPAWYSSAQRGRCRRRSDAMS